jgi:SAM-dependent methyltransferase
LDQAEFRLADATGTGLPDASFDVVVCVFGVFFAADMLAFVREMARLVRPGGTVALTTWGPGLFEPASSVFWDAVRAQRPELYKAYNPWDSVTTAAAVASLLAGADLADIIVESAAGSHLLPRPEDFWDVVLGSGYRATIDALPPDGQDAVERWWSRRCARSRWTGSEPMSSSVSAAGQHPDTALACPLGGSEVFSLIVPSRAATSETSVV